MNQVPDPTEAEIFASSDPFGADQESPFGDGSQAFGPGAPFGGRAGPADLTSAHSAHLRVTCFEVEHRLQVYLDGELPVPQHRALTAHLGACPPCQRAHTFQLQLRSVVATKAFDPMPEDVRARITRALGLD